eukprot:s3673_g14.t1
MSITCDLTMAHIIFRFLFLTFPQEIQETREAEDLVESLEERRWRMAMSAKQVTSGAAEGELRQELSKISEDLTSLFMRVEQSEVGLYSLADAVSRVCEEIAGELNHRTPLTRSTASTAPAVTQPTPGFAGASVVADSRVEGGANMAAEQQLESLEKAQKAAAEEAAKSQDSFERELAAMQVQEEFAFAAAADAVNMEGAMSPAVKGGAGSSLKSVVERLQEQLTIELKAKDMGLTWLANRQRHSSMK